MDRSEVCPNRKKLNDSFYFVPKPTSVNTALLKNLYENQGLSTAQIAEHLGTSRPTVSALLARAGIKIRPAESRSNNPENYRQAAPPFGFALKDGHLVENKKERQICALIVKRFHEGRTSSQIATELGKLGHKNRRGSANWHHWSVTQINTRWKDRY